MGIFSKPTPGKPGAKPSGADVAADRPSARSGAVSARELAAHVERKGPPMHREPADESVTGASLIEWSQPQAIEVAQANPGLCAVLENAALLYANGQAAQARTLLEQGVATDLDTKQSPLAWLALFDLLQRAGDRGAFDQYSLQYSVQFERSAPAWEEHRNARRGVKLTPGGFIAITGPLSAESHAQLEGLRRAIAKKLPQARLDLSGVTRFDGAGAALLAAALASARKAHLLLSIERSTKLVAALHTAVKAGREAGEGAWLLALELMQWSHDQATFDERAIEFAIAFEVSPPSWEPPPKPKDPQAEPQPAPPEPATPDTVVYRGTIVANAAPQVARLLDFAHGRHLIPVDMTEVDRVDFVCAGALLNAVNRVEQQRKTVQIVGATPIIRALLLLIGLSPRHFVKKAA